MLEILEIRDRLPIFRNPLISKIRVTQYPCVRRVSNGMPSMRVYYSDYCALLFMLEWSDKKRGYYLDRQYAYARPVCFVEKNFHEFHDYLIKV